MGLQCQEGSDRTVDIVGPWSVPSLWKVWSSSREMCTSELPGGVMKSGPRIDVSLQRGHHRSGSTSANIALSTSGCGAIEQGREDARATDGRAAEDLIDLR